MFYSTQQERDAYLLIPPMFQGNKAEKYIDILPRY